MADENSQRPYRSSETIARSAQGKPVAAGNDPLAELARLIGQSDPFGEFSRENVRRSGGAQPQTPAQPDAAYAAASPTVPAQDYGAQNYFNAPPAQPQAYEPQDYAPPAGYDPAAFAAQTHDAPPFAQNGAPAYSAAGVYDPNQPPYAAEEYDSYDDVPPSKRRMGIMVVAGIFALAIIGTAGAFGYRAVFGGSRSSAPPPVIKADTAPSKVVPSAASKDAQPSKAITDRVGPQGEKLVSREETPVDRPPVVADNQPSAQPGTGSGVVTNEPKRVRTIAIHPDAQGGANMADASPVAATTAPSAAPLALMPEQPTRQVQTQRIPATPPAAPQPQPQAQAMPQPQRPVAPPPQAQAPTPVAAQASGNAPLSLNPNSAPAARAQAPTRSASLPPQSAGGHTVQYGVQVASQRSEAEAEAAYRALEGKFGAQLGGKPHFVYKVELGAKGTYYRAMVGPFARGEEASAVCSSLKSAGGQCIIQRN